MRIFLGIDLPDEVKEYIHSLKLPNIHGTYVEKHNLHITLHFFGEMNQKDTHDIISKLKTIEFSKFETELTEIGTFPSWDYIEVIWIGVKDKYIKELKIRIDSVLGVKNTKFHAHITLGRVKFIPDKSQFNKKVKDIKIENMKFVINAYQLKKSELTSKGPIYENIAVFN